ncbi:MAG TPA: pyridoxal phosphate-dependent aminotransferase [Lentimicrobium sp.]|nr:pyridoxal phosphate-dependent aminotransferase [Lentimicrobium sp.]
MNIESFKLERYFAKHEFTSKYLLSSSDCDGFSLDYVLSSAQHGELELWNDLKFGYTDSLGHPLLRDAICRHYRTIGREDVFVLSPGEANFILMLNLLKPGDELVCMKPAYQSLYQVAKSIGCNILWWECNKTGYYDPDVLASLVTAKTKLIVINFPHNPTGYYPSKIEYERIIEIAAKHNTVLFSDEMYHKLVHDPLKINDSAADLYENAISLWGTAKSFGLAGLRIGWVVSHNKELLDEMKRMKDYLTICNSAPSEILTIIALNNSERFIDVNLQKIRKNKIVFRDFVNKHKEMFPNYHETTAGSTSLVRMNIDEPTISYTDKLVRKTGIMIVPSELFEYGNSHIRIGFGRENMPEALDLWDQYITTPH